MGFVWEHDNKDSEYWKELITLHSLIKYCVWGELLLSFGIICLLFIDYRETYGKNLNPIDFNYENKKTEPMINF